MGESQRVNEIYAFHQRLNVLENSNLSSRITAATLTGLLCTAFSNSDTHMMSMVSPNSSWIIDSGA